MKSSIFQRGAALVALLWREVAKFGVVGGLGWVVDNGIFNLAAFWPDEWQHDQGASHLQLNRDTFSWFANRYWTFRHRRGQQPWREFAVFILMSLIGMGIAVACQFISRYVLGFQTYSADLISGGVIGLILGTILGSSLIDSSSSKRNLIRDLGMPKTEN